MLACRLVHIPDRSSPGWSKAVGWATLERAPEAAAGYPVAWTPPDGSEAPRAAERALKRRKSQTLALPRGKL
eukprot:scaffold15884_cov74-Phaeocystis_antarctica.AAC.1